LPKEAVTLEDIREREEEPRNASLEVMFMPVMDPVSRKRQAVSPGKEWLRERQEKVADSFRDRFPRSIQKE
jgi:hypothetical protein